MFNKPDGFVFEPGQFVELTLPHPKHDDRGEKRWFTISSSPTEGDLMITTRLVENRSSFKNALAMLKPGDQISMEGPMGKFIMPNDPSKELVWIAGGIGVTPFRSQTKFLLDNQENNRTITLIYANRTQADICFDDLWNQAINNMPRFKLVQTLVDDIPNNWSKERGVVDEAMILRAIGNVTSQEFYLSGPEPMVEDFKPKLLAMGVKEDSIHQDWFPNYTEKFFAT